MNLLFWGLTIGVVGKVVLGVAVLRVHMDIMEEHRIDGAVIRAIKRERWVTMLALALIIVGYVMEVAFYGTTTPLLTCEEGECAAMLNAAFNN